MKECDATSGTAAAEAALVLLMVSACLKACPVTNQVTNQITNRIDNEMWSHTGLKARLLYAYGISSQNEIVAGIRLEVGL